MNKISWYLLCSPVYFKQNSIELLIKQSCQLSAMDYLHMYVCWSRSVVSISWSHGVCNPWNFPGQNPGVGSLSLLWESSQPTDRTQVSYIAICMSSLEKCLFSSLAHFLFGRLFFWNWAAGVACIFLCLILCQWFHCYYFLPFWRLLFHLAYSFFIAQRLLSLICGYKIFERMH